MMTIGTLCLCALVTVSAGPATVFGANTWTAEPARSNVTLTVSNLFVSKITGNIPFESGSIVTTDGAALPRSVRATLDAARLDTRNAARDADLRSNKFFDTARFPIISFASERITATGKDSFTIDGALTMRGVTRDLRLDAHLAGLRTDADGRQHARYEATGKFRRSDYGMTYARPIVGNAISLRIEIEAVRE